jgi:prepilin-type N-terminal cleavage/methylation domain-containing protein
VNYKKSPLKTLDYTKFAFTLAEVLITLVIIGVIAAITVPSILQNTQRQEYVSKVKKANSVLKQSVYRIALREGLPVADFSSLTDDEFFEDFAKTVNVAKLCTGSTRGCFADKTTTLNGSTYNFNTNNALITTDGIAFGWKKASGDGGYCRKGITEEDEANCIGRFVVDVNGASPPNRYGYDVFFWLAIDKKGIIPAGSGNNSADCKRTNEGSNCAAKVLKESKISYL